MARSRKPSQRPAASPRWPVVLAWALWALVPVGLGAAVWLDHLLRQAGASEMTWMQAFGIPSLVAQVSAATVGALVASRRPLHPVGWLLLALGLSLAAAGVVYAYVRYGLVARPGSLPGAGYLAGFSNGALAIWLGLASFVLLLTPTGSLPSPRWRWWGRVAAAAAIGFVALSVIDPQPLYPEYPAVANPLAVPDTLVDLVRGGSGAMLVVTVLGLPVAAASLLVRFRRARGLERQQLRWVAVGAALGAVALVLAVLGVTLSVDLLLHVGSGACIALPTLAIGAAILRYRLYDLDRIVSRTLAYGLLTVLLGVGYAGVVLVLGQVLGQDRSSLVVAGATLAVAAVFQPARRRIQGLVDRRFNRHRYDAERTIAAFSGRLRQQTDLDALTAELLTVVDQTMQPTRAALWLRPVGRQSTHGAGRAGGATDALA